MDDMLMESDGVSGELMPVSDEEVVGGSELSSAREYRHKMPVQNAKR